MTQIAIPASSITFRGLVLILLEFTVMRTIKGLYIIKTHTACKSHTFKKLSKSDFSSVKRLSAYFYILINKKDPNLIAYNVTVTAAIY